MLSVIISHYKTGGRYLSKKFADFVFCNLHRRGKIKRYNGYFTVCNFGIYRYVIKVCIESDWMMENFIGNIQRRAAPAGCCIDIMSIKRVIEKCKSVSLFVRVEKMSLLDGG